jgi:hypothetical protein
MNDYTEQIHHKFELMQTPFYNRFWQKILSHQKLVLILLATRPPMEWGEISLFKNHLM